MTKPNLAVPANLAHGSRTFFMVVLLLLSVSQAFGHLAFVPNDSVIGHYRYQIRLAEGLEPGAAEVQLRVLFPKLVALVGAAVPRQLGEYHHARVSLVAGEWITIAFSIFALFLLAEVILPSTLLAFLAVVAYSVYLPHLFQLAFRFGEALIVGLFSGLVYAALTGRTSLFLALLVVASFQRVDVAVTGVVFKALRDYDISKRFAAIARNAALLAIPAGIASVLARFYAVDVTPSLLELAATQLPRNVRYLPYLVLTYLPVFVLAAWRFRAFRREIYLTLGALVPYVAVVAVLGSFFESRLLHPLVATLIIGVFSTFDGGARGFRNGGGVSV